uniref:Uncharacterized protein n=1 Tax=viral metagenome TaxID=1070528 RepID=A0A6M3JIA7_9ZZZZ
MNWFIIIFKLVWSKISPQIRESIVNFVIDLEKKAAQTDNPIDDVAVQILKLILGIV